jgi:hypothetical protein
MTLRNSVVALVRIVKSIREMSCDPFLGDQDAKITRWWIKKIKKTLIQIKVQDKLRVDCASQLLTDRA